MFQSFSALALLEKLFRVLNARHALGDFVPYVGYKKNSCFRDTNRRDQLHREHGTGSKL